MQKPQGISDEEYEKLDWEGQLAESRRLDEEESKYQEWLDAQNPPSPEELEARKAYIKLMADKAQSGFSPNID